MLRSLLLSLLIIVFAYVLKLYVDSFKSTKGQEEIVNTLEDIRIRAYSKIGIEWTITGRALEVVGKDVKLSDAELFSEDVNIKSTFAYIDRSSGEGKLTEGVEFKSKDINARTKTAYINLKEGRIWGDGEIELIQEKNHIRGEGFDITLRPLKVIINKARVNME